MSQDLSEHINIPSASPEQLAIVQHLIQHQNVQVDSVFGSGKTTTVLHVAQQCSHLNILCFTYSKNLKEETRLKVDKLGIKNLEIHSFHSFAVRYYHSQARNNIITVKKYRRVPKYRMPNYDLLIIDEIQDMTPDIYEYVSYIMQDVKPKQLLIIGDQYQCIFKFKHADNRYLTLGNKLFNNITKPWSDLKLTMSFRVTNQIGYFINTQLVGYDRVVTCKNGPPVNYIIYNPFKNMDYICDMIKQYIHDGYKYDDIFILSPSVKSNNPSVPLNMLENMLVTYNIPVIVQKNDSDEKMDQRETAGKIAFCTYHSVKGLERKICFVFGFDSSYFTYYARTESTKKCPATIYVACSRSLEHLTLVHDSRRQYLPFMKPTALGKTNDIKMINLCRMKIQEPRPNKKPEAPTINVTDLVKFLPEKLYDTLIDQITIEVVNDIEGVINTDIMVEMGTLVENVSTLYGTCIPLLSQMKNNPDDIIKYFNYVRNGLNLYRYKRYLTTLEKIYDDAISNIWVHKDIMWFTNCFMMLQSGYIHKMVQILHYDWVDEAGIDAGVNRLQEYVRNGNLYEIPASRVMKKVSINGIPDMINEETKTLWEFKFVNDLTHEHILQLVCYYWMLGYDLNEWKLYLFNIKNGQILQITDMVDVDAIVEELVIQKYYRNNRILTDEEFINTNLKEANDERYDRVKYQRWMKTRPIPCD